MTARLGDLSARVRRLGYRPKSVRRVYIPKSNGRRALGIPSFEDRIVQDRTSLILQAIWEREFRECSYGFRPGRNAHQALKRLTEIITVERTQWIVEVDIKGFFDTVRHDKRWSKVARRIDDKEVMPLLKLMLKAAGKPGVPQGGVITPTTILRTS